METYKLVPDSRSEMLAALEAARNLGAVLEGGELQLLIETEPEAVRWRRRTMFLLSVILHALFILFLLVEPELFRRGARMFGISLEAKPAPETTFLYMPPDLQKPAPAPRTNILSDKNRRAQGPSPTVNPNGLPMPYLRGNSQLPEIAGGKAVMPSPPAAAPNPPPAGTPPAPKKEEMPTLEDVRPASPGANGQLRLPASTPGEAIQQSLRAAMQGRGAGSIPGAGDSTSQFNNINPNFSTEAPVILSDTLGVDFGPYLARVVFNVRRNWYAVIPEAARLGQKGRVAIIFEILKDGSVPQIRLVSSSGAEPLDLAALAAIKASNPFPPLPSEFTGKHLVLQFIFLYNLGYGT